MKKYFFVLSLFCSIIFSQCITPKSVALMSKTTQDSVIAIPKGSRPAPSTYLHAAYIEKHLANFAQGASYLVPKDVLDRFGRKLLGRPDGQFVMAKKEMDRLLKKSKGNLAYIETELGIPAGAWKGKTLVRIDIPQPQKLNLRLPSGNEGGANALWLPGGKLPNGYLEAVLNQIPEGSYTETMIDVK